MPPAKEVIPGCSNSLSSSRISEALIRSTRLAYVGSYKDMAMRPRASGATMSSILTYLQAQCDIGHELNRLCWSSGSGQCSGSVGKLARGPTYCAAA